MSGGNSISNFNFLDNVRDSARAPEENRILKPMFGLCLIFAGNINCEDPSLGGRGEECELEPNKTKYFRLRLSYQVRAKRDRET